MRFRIRTKQNLFVGICTFFCILLMVITICVDRMGQIQMQIADISLSVTSLNGILSSLITMFCILIVGVKQVQGACIAASILGTHLIFMMYPLIIMRSFDVIPGIVHNLIIMIVVLILEKQFSNREKISVTDYLTELKNRRGLMRELDLKWDKRAYQLFYIDIDDFKVINDTLGHGAGDTVLRTIADRLSDIGGKNSLVARIGGDEFVIVLPKSYDSERIAKQIINKVCEKILVTDNGKSILCHVTVSIGIASYPFDTNSTEHILKYADMAMYEAKKKGKNCFQMFNQNIEDSIFHRANIEAMIRDAIEHDIFYLEYQPQYEIAGKKLRGFETLIRLKDKNGKNVNPGELIAIAEESELILSIDQYVLTKTMRDFSRVIAESGKQLTLSVNVSAQNICRNEFIPVVEQAIAATKFPCDCLEIEITEYCFMGTFEIATKNIAKLKKMGIKVALDDFGTGYASLAYLTKLSIDLLKIDKSFVDNIANDHQSSAFIDAVITIGHTTGCKVISEGVETEEQCRLLHQLGCDYIQGYLWGRPLSFEKAIELVYHS